MSDEVIVEAEETPAEQESKKKRSRIILLATFAALSGWLGYKWWFSLSHVSTDNAQVAGHLIPILPKVGGFVTAVKVTDNQEVKAGTLLLTIDDRDYRTRLAQAEAELQMALSAAGKEGGGGQAAAQLAASRASAAAARSNIDQAVANADKAQKDLDRIRSLVDKKMMSPQSLDSAEAAARAALAQVKAMRDSAASAGEQVSASGAALQGAMAKVEAARAVRDLAAIQLADTMIVAPVAGVVGNKTVEPGQLLQVGQSLMSVVPLDDVWVVANLKETDVARVKPGNTVDIEIDAYPGEHFTGTVESVAPASGALFSLLPPDNATGNFTKVVQRIPVRIKLNKANDASHSLRPGMSAFVTIATK
ncbi:HlyD family secretion protein [Azonexus sp. IMCC34839]|uniref:HlyD family secretion protein n=1 Tax=Azonexus sp. IMCC34839 TaxID=3133695 RepID=UPI00399A3AE9